MKKENIKNYQSLASALVDLFGKSVAIMNTDRIQGGDINKAYGLTLNTGDKVFMKANAKDCLSYFTGEAQGIEAIKATKSIQTAEILCTGTDDGEDVGYSFLLQRFIKSEEADEKFWKDFACKLAEMHKADCSSFLTEKNAKFGFYSDNFIGRTPQINSPKASWIDFFRENRLEVQFKKAQKNFSESELAKITKFLDNLDKFLPEADKASLLHGDLWRGNVMCGKNQTPILIDPAVFVGNREADIAMTELFGGFPEIFYSTYKECYPLMPEYENRRDIYNLYHLLNHLNLFGQSYLEPVLSIVSEYL